MSISDRPQGQNDKYYIITFTDLIYAALLAYSLTLLHSAFEEISYTTLVIVFSVILLVYDWYGEHLIAVQRKVGTAATVFDFAAFLIYFGLLYTSAQVSYYVFLFMAIRALRGLIYNFMLMAKQPAVLERMKLKSWSISSSLMLLTYFGLFIATIYDVALCDIVFIISLISIWAVSYLIAYILEKTYLIRRI